jgi:hypothetical protein
MCAASAQAPPPLWKNATAHHGAQRSYLTIYQFRALCYRPHETAI